MCEHGDYIWECDLTMKFKAYQNFQEKSMLKIGNKWTDVRKQKHQELM